MTSRRRRRSAIAPLPDRFRHGFPAGTDEDPARWTADLTQWANEHPAVLDVRQLVDLMLTAPQPTPEQHLAQLSQRLATPLED